MDYVKENSSKTKHENTKTVTVTLNLKIPYTSVQKILVQQQIWKQINLIYVILEGEKTQNFWYCA